MTENEISKVVLTSAIEVHRTLGGPGLLESVYEEALAWELSQAGLGVSRQVTVPVTYKGRALGTPLRLDLLVGDKVIVECKATSQCSTLFEAQPLTYLRLTRLKLGLVINLCVRLVKDGFYRVVNGSRGNAKTQRRKDAEKMTFLCVSAPPRSIATKELICPN